METKRFLIIMTLLMSVGFGAYAIDFPSYHPTYPNFRHNRTDAKDRPETERNTLFYGGSVLSGGTTTTGECGAYDETSGSSGSGNRGRRAMSGNNMTGWEGTPDHVWEWKGVTYGTDDNGNFFFWDDAEGEWSQMAANLNPGDYGEPYSPLGDPLWPMMAFALLAVGVITLRRIYGYGEHRKAES